MSSPASRENPLHLLGAGFGHHHRALLLVDFVVDLFAGIEFGDEGVDGVVEIGAVVERTGNDERRARLVDQDRVHLVDDRVGVSALHHLRELVLHVVAQVIEAELVIGAVSDVAGIGFLPLLVVEPVHDHADREPEELIDLPHPFGVAFGEVVVDRHHMDAFAGERVQIHRKRRDQCFAFAGLHLGDRALVQDHAADQLDVEMALAERAFGRFADRGESRHQEFVERRAGRDLLAEFVGAGAQRLVGERRELGLQRIDLVDAGLIGAHAPVVGRAENLAGEGADHRGAFLVVRSNGH